MACHRCHFQLMVSTALSGPDLADCMLQVDHYAVVCHVVLQQLMISSRIIHGCWVTWHMSHGNCTALRCTVQRMQSSSLLLQANSW